MSVLAHGVIRSASIGAAFLMTASNTSDHKVAAPLSQPVEKSKPKSPEAFADDVDRVVGDLRRDFKQRVAEGRPTIFNGCFSRAGGGVSPDSVRHIRGETIFKPAHMEKMPDFQLSPVVVLDRGHGHETPGSRYGYDTGAVRGDLVEARLVDRVAGKVRAHLENYGARVVETRGPVESGGLGAAYKFKDQERALQWRSEVSHTLSRQFPEHPVMFLSIHANTAPSPKASGAEIFYYGNGNIPSESSAFAKSIAVHYRTPKGGVAVKSADFGVLRCQHAQTPSVLIELGYITNKQDYAFLRNAMQSEQQADRIAAMIVSGIDDFIAKKRQQQMPQPDITVARANTMHLQ